ncbi:hypothetical protein PR202_ga30237 [Eleusine coracana subsp. coracana]|uniref:Glabrous enhancer-binding protein-like DBD domain-containing protein n=1 Tax=Eleusine coracana subsp. coracana TaxID=191504 RepID=A0AAV5DP60_ELECO|nr:hypothetical protein PR202_ga30237 [Eleusine coracana subsp. coracana]
MAPKRPAPPPPPAESSGSEETGSGSEESEEEIAPSPPKNTAPQSDREESESEDEEKEDEEGTDHEEEEEGETDDEAEHQENPAPKKDEAEARSGKPQSSKDKKPAARIQQSWSNDDEVRILEAVAEHRRKHGKMPQSTELEAALADKLDRSDYGGKELMTKLHALKALYKSCPEGCGIPANATLLRDVNELCEEYPYFAEEVKAAESSNPGLFKRGFIEEDKARVLNDKIKKQRLRQVKLELRILDATKEVTKVLMNLM